MGVKDFLADLAEARATAFDNVSNIRKGDSDGEITFAYEHESLDAPLSLQVLATDVTSYPDGSSFLVFTVSDHNDSAIFKFLENAASATNGAYLRDAIQWAAEGLTSQILKKDNESGTYNSSDEDAGPDDISESFETIDVFNDEFYGFDERDSLAGSITDDFDISRLDNQGLALLYKDLVQAERSGLVAGLIVPKSIGTPVAASLTLQVSDLGVPQEALNAWDVKPTDFLVLLIRWNSKYPTLSELLAKSELCGFPQLLLGKCESWRPSLRSVRAAFGISWGEDTEDTVSHFSASPARNADFMPIHMSNTINNLLSDHFIKLLRLRRSHSLSWDEAQGIIIAQERRSDTSTDAINTGQSQTRPNRPNDDSPVCQTDRRSFQRDFALDTEETFSFPLVAMQFALRRLVRCTKYCMVCHQRLVTELESVKPYVCSDDLCLYQYLSLGLGPSIESDIVANPYVVDILISFFYAALTSCRLRDFPAGLNLKAPLIAPNVQVPSKFVLVDTCLSDSIITMPNGGLEAGLDSVRKGTWFIMLMNKGGSICKSVCRPFSRVQPDSFSFETVSSVSCGHDIPIDLVHLHLSTSWKGDNEWNKALLFPFDQDIDDLEGPERNEALRQLLLCAPSVLQMRSYLMAEPGRTLSTCELLPRSTLGLIRWIVASNRSCIVQDSDVPDVAEIAFSTQSQPTESQPTQIPNRILHVGKEWMQFRFAQGSPEKELQFMKVLDELASGGWIAKQHYPSLFAWHGSPLGNWHSIIRSGLDFQQMVNGRAYGQGVYFSRDMGVSSTYSYSATMPPATPTAYASPVTLQWPTSELQVSCALSVCEIVNRPNAFVCKSPHYVVDKLEWIQCRYLLVKVEPTSKALALPSVQATLDEPEDFVQQDPGNCIRDGRGKVLHIPSSSTPRCRRKPKRPAGNNQQEAKDPVLGEQGVAPGSGDLEFLRELLAEHEQRQTLKRSLSLTSIGFDPLKPLHMDGEPAVRSDSPNKKAAHAVNTSTYSFQPGTLDYSSIPQLPEPSWIASAPATVKSLNREVKELHNIQQREDTYTLGWYMDTSRVDNLFQWIVELHTFAEELPLAQDMLRNGCSSIVLEIRFGSGFPIAPPFVRVVRPRFKPFAMGGGGHVTAGGAICSELLTNSGWSPALSMEKVLLQVRLGLCDMSPPARLMDTAAMVNGFAQDYQIGEAIDAYRRAAQGHGWQIPKDFDQIAQLQDA